MNRKKIEDFVGVWADVVGATDELKTLTTELLAEMTEKYSKIIPEGVSIEDDDYTKYIIKPVDGRYSIEDLFLNRLLSNVTGIDYEDYYENEYDNFNQATKRLKVNSNKEANKRILPRRERVKSIMNVIQTRYSSNGAPVNGTMPKYVKMIEGLSKIEDGKYREQIVAKKEFLALDKDRHNEIYEQTGLVRRIDHNMRLVKYKEAYNYLNEKINRDLNEHEMHEIADTNEYIDEYIGDYRPQDREYLEGLKGLIDYKHIIEGIYINSDKIIEPFDEKYTKEFQEIFRNENDAWENLIETIGNRERSSESKRRLQEIFTKYAIKKDEVDTIGEKKDYMETSITPSSRKLQLLKLYNADNKPEYVKLDLESQMLRREYVKGLIGVYNELETTEEYNQRKANWMKDGMAMLNEIKNNEVEGYDPDKQFEYNEEEIKRFIQKMKVAEEFSEQMGEDYLNAWLNVTSNNAKVADMMEHRVDKVLEQQVKDKKDKKVFAGSVKTMMLNLLLKKAIEEDKEVKEQDKGENKKVKNPFMSELASSVNSQMAVDARINEAKNKSKEKDENKSI